VLLGLRMKAVLGVDFQAEPIFVLAVPGAAKQDRAGVAPDGRPGHPAGQVVHRVRLGRLSEGELEFGAAECGPSDIDPVRLGSQQLVRSAGKARRVGSRLIAG
jgi:hypothetical protein